MDKNCKSCHFCTHINTETSPGGVMLIDNYKCSNEASPIFGNDMNKITAQGSTLDARENERCDKWEKQTPTEFQKEIIDYTDKVKTVNVPVNVGKDNQDISIKDVDDSSSVKINDGIQSISYSRGTLKINGQKIDVPQRVIKSLPNRIVQESDTLYVNGFKYEDGKFNRTISSWLKCVFA